MPEPGLIVTLTINLDPNEARWLIDRAQKNGWTVQDVVVGLITDAKRQEDNAGLRKAVRPMKKGTS